MAVDPFLLDYDRGELAVASEFLTNWLPFLTRGLCDGCSALIRRRVESIAPGESAETLEDPREVGPRGFEEIQATGWDPDPEPEPDRSETESDLTPALPVWGLVSVPVTTGWDAPAEVYHAVVPSGWDAPPEVALELVRVQNGWDVEPERPQTPVPVIPKPTGWDVDSPPTSEEGNVDLQPAVEEGSVKSGWDSVPEEGTVKSGCESVLEEETVDVPPATEEGNAKEKVKLSWADMAEDEELGGEEVTSKSPISECGGTRKKAELTREQRELIRFRKVQRKKDFICLERVRGRFVNVLAGLELHTGVFSAVEQKRIVDFVYELQEKGMKNDLGEHTYSKPRKWMRGKGRETIQFGCCYNYAAKNGNPPGILKNVLSDPLPPLFKTMIKRMVQWHVLPPSVVPDSCIVNIYEPEDCIPPHIDSHDFVRPFCTVSFLSECNILFGSELKIAGPGEFEGSFAIPLPVGSVLVLNGNGADVAKHCVPAVPTKRISITFRTMDERKRPLDFVPEPDLQNLLPLPYDSDEDVSMNNTGTSGLQSERRVTEIKHSMVKLEQDFYQSQHPSYLPETPMRRSSHRDVDTVPPSSINGMDRVRGSAGRLAGRLSEPRTSDRGLLGFGPGQVNTDTLVGRSPRQGIQDVRIHDVRTANLDGSSEQRGWRGHLEQKRTVLSSNKNMQGEDTYLLDEESSQGYSGRRPMFEQQQTVSRRDGPLLEQQRTVSRRDEPLLEQQRTVSRQDEPLLEQQRTASRREEVFEQRRSVSRRGESMLEQQQTVTRRDGPMLDQQRFGVRPQDIGHRRGWADLSYR